PDVSETEVVGAGHGRGESDGTGPLPASESLKDRLVRRSGCVVRLIDHHQVNTGDLGEPVGVDEGLHRSHDHICIGLVTLRLDQAHVQVRGDRADLVHCLPGQLVAMDQDQGLGPVVLDQVSEGNRLPRAHRKNDCGSECPSLPRLSDRFDRLELIGAGFQDHASSPSYRSWSGPGDPIPGHRDYTSPRIRTTSRTVATGGASFRRIQSSSRGPVSQCAYPEPRRGYTADRFYKEDTASASVLKVGKTHTHAQAHATVDSLSPSGLGLRGFDW